MEYVYAVNLFQLGISFLSCWIWNSKWITKNSCPLALYWLNYYFDLIWLYFSSTASFITELYATVTISKTDVTVKPLCTTSAVLLLLFFYFKYTFLVKRWLCCNWISFKVFLCKEKNPALWYLWLMWRKLVIYRKWLMIRVGLFNGNEKLHA